VWDQFGLRVDRIFAAADAVRDNNGNIVCRVSTFAAGAAAFPGCQPINLFGSGNASGAAVDYVTGFEAGQNVTTPIYFAEDGFASGESYSYTSGEAKRGTTTFQQHFAELSTSGDLVDLWAGPLSIAFGGSWRRDSILQLVQDVTNPASNHDNPSPRPVLANNAALGLRGVSGPDAGNTVGVQFSKVSNIRGISQVWEGFGEALLPLFDGDNFSAVANAAVRWADYSGSGSIWAYKGGLELEFADSFRLRGTYSRDVRAANLSERFDKTGGTATIDDPRTTAVEALTVTRFSGGNPAVRPEEADTFTVGAVFSPRFIDGLSMSLDYYDINIEGAISQVGNQAVLNRCFLEKAQEFCDLITLDSGIATPTATGSFVLIGDVFVNVAQAAVRGVDFETSYRSDVNLFGGEESINVRMFASWLLERSETSSTGARTDFAGQTGATQGSQVYQPYADFKATAGLTYRNGGLSTLLQVRYTGAGYQDVCGVQGRCPVFTYLQDNTVEDVAYIDLRLGYDFEWDGADFEVFGNITNLTDEDPPLTPSYSAFNGYSTQINTGVYDVLGRRYTVGLRIRM
jgi:outer membrane receptor protein involved in Fe transport